MWTAAATILLAGGVGVVANAARSGDAVASACSKDRARAVVNGVTYKTRVYLVQEGMGPAVTADNTRVRLSVKANLMTDGRTGASFPFEFPNPYQATLNPKNDGGSIVGFDVGMFPVIGGGAGQQDGFTKDSTRLLCIPPEEGYGSKALPGIPANSTLLIEMKLLEILPPTPTLHCKPHAEPVEHCPGGLACPPSGVCPAPPAPAPPPGPPPGPPLPPAPPSGKCLGGLVAGDCQAWTDIYDATGGANWIACSDKRLDPCSCESGVDPISGLHHAEITCTTTTQDTRITSFALGPNNLIGSIPASISNLTKLDEFGIFANPGLAGSVIPSTIGLVANPTLRRAHLYGNGFVGEIPASMGRLVSLEKLMLCENSLNGSIPASFANLTKMKDLELHHNQLTGLVPVLDFAGIDQQCSLDAKGASPRGPSSPKITGE